MNIGFIGAGKVGCTLGKYFAEGGLSVSGYYSIPRESSQEAAHFTNTCSYESAEDLIRECDMIFVTVPDGMIQEVWKEIRNFPIKDKIICHCSGAMSSQGAFAGIEETGALGYSIHPLFAVSDRFNTYRELEGIFFTIEGAPDKMDDVLRIFGKLGNPTRIISPEDKTKYHLAAATASNLVCSVLDMSFQLMVECGFTSDDARIAMASLIKGNVDHVLEAGTVEGLTGPIERNDQVTVAKHLDCLHDRGSAEDEDVYRLLSGRLVNMASRRHPEWNYSGMYQLLKKGQNNEENSRKLTQTEGNRQENLNAYML